MPLRYGAGVGDNSIRLDAPNPLEQPAPLRTIGPVRAVTAPLGNIVGAPFFVGTDTGCAVAEFGVTGSVHITAALGVGLCPPNETLGNAWINNQLVIGADPTGTQTLRVGGAVKATGQVDFTVGPLIVGTDPGGSESLRVGGSIRATGAIIDITTGFPLRVRDTTGGATGELAFDLIGGATPEWRVALGAIDTQTNRMILTPAALRPAAAGGLTLGTHQALPWGDAQIGTTLWFHSVATRRVAIYANAASDFRIADSAGTDRYIFLSTEFKPATAGGAILGTAALPWGEVRWGNGTSGGRQYISTPDVVIGSATNHRLVLMTNAGGKWQIETAGHLFAATDNTYDIGASGAMRPKNVYVSQGVGARHANITAVGTGAATVETTLMSHTLPTLVNGDSVDVVIAGSFTGTAGTRLIRLKIGATTLATQSEGGVNGGGVYITVRLTKDSTTTHVAGSSGTAGQPANAQALIGAAVDLSAATLDVTGQTTNSADEVTAEAFLVSIWKV